MHKSTLQRNEIPAMASEPFLGEIIIFLFRLLRTLLSFLGFRGIPA